MRYRFRLNSNCIREQSDVEKLCVNVLIHHGLSSTEDPKDNAFHHAATNDSSRRREVGSKSQECDCACGRLPLL
jgi:hypothetical protein